MTYELRVTSNFEREFDRLRAVAVQRRIWRKVQALKSRPESGSLLVGTEDPEFGRLWKLRVGDYRVIYALDHAGKRVILCSVGHRRRAYRGLGD